ncbi:MAG: AMP-binding protein [Methylomonas sp.]
MITNLDQLLRQAAETFQDSIALVGRAGLRDDPWSYVRLNQTVEGIAWQLRHDYGFLPGERILICGLTDPQLVAAYFGCFRAGLVVVPLGPHSSADFIDRIAESTEAKALLSK